MTAVSQQRVRIHERDCIGCGKCIHICQREAIVGTRRQPHHVLPERCMGCARCVSPCPVGCIELYEDTGTAATPTAIAAEKPGTESVDSFETRRKAVKAAVDRVRAKRGQ